MNQNNQNPSSTIFIGSLSLETTERDLKRYFGTFGKILRAKLIVDIESGKSKQCALLFCSSAQVARSILAEPVHIINGRQIRLDAAADDKKSTKCSVDSTLFVGNLKKSTTEDTVRNYFQSFGEVIGLKLFAMTETSKTLNAVVNFGTKEAAELVMSRPNKHKLEGRHMRCSRYKSKDHRSQEKDDDVKVDQLQESSYEIDSSPKQSSPVAGSSHQYFFPTSTIGTTHSFYGAASAYKGLQSDQYSYYCAGNSGFDTQETYSHESSYPQNPYWAESSLDSDPHWSENDGQFVLAVELEVDPLFHTFCGNSLASDQR